MKAIVLLEKGANVGSVVAEAKTRGRICQRPAASTRFLIAEGTGPLGVLESIAGVVSVEPDGEKFQGAANITIGLDAVSGPWPILRHTARDNPFPDGLKLPISRPFSSVRNGAGVDVFIVDTGIRTTHQEFGGRATNLDGFVPNNHHGTSCASCAAGNTLGLARAAEVFVAAGLRNGRNGTTSEILAALDRCLQEYRTRASLNRPGVLSLSFAGTTTAYEAVIGEMIDEGLTVLAAASNDRTNLDGSDVFPAEVPGVGCVGGTNMADGPYDYNGFGTNFGTSVDILGGSQQVRLADIANDTAYFAGSGTSFGCPHVAGVVACMLQGYDRPTTRAQVYSILNYLYEQATFGRYKPDPRFEPMTPAIAYLDPGSGPWVDIPGLTKT